MGNNKNPYYNQSGYADPTAYYGIKAVIKDETETDNKAHDLIKVLKFIINCAGFELIERIEIKHKASGKEYR